MSSSEFSFDIGEDVYLSVYDVTIADMNRPHKHEHVEEGLEDAGVEWELVERSEELRRGSTQLYLVEDEYFVECSRTGLERAGNSLKFSSETPENIVFSVVSAVFEGVLRRNSVDISNGINKEDFFSDDGSLNVCSPKEFVLVQECTKEEIESYYDELADLLYVALERYMEAETVKDIEDIVDWYNRESKNLYRDYTDFEPSILSQVIPEMKGRNGWIIRETDIDGGKTLHVIINENNTIDKRFVIEIYQDENIEIIEQESGTVVDSATYDSKQELKSTLREFMQYSFDELEDLTS